MSTNLVATEADYGQIVERVVVSGDLSKLTPTDRVTYYKATCSSLGLNPLTKPFDYINLSGKLMLYATRTATDQLRSLRCVSVRVTRRELNTELGIYSVDVEATTPDGRCDFASGVVSLGNLKADALANAMMKAETKAKRRATLSICGLGVMDETELETVPTARRVAVDHTTGVVAEQTADTDKFALASAAIAEAEDMERVMKLVDRAGAVFANGQLVKLLGEAKSKMNALAEASLVSVADAAECERIGSGLAHCKLFSKDEQTAWLLKYTEKTGKLLEGK